MFILHSDAGSFSEIDLNTFDFGTTREVAVGSGTVWGKLAVAKVCHSGQSSSLPAQVRSRVRFGWGFDAATATGCS